MTEPKLERLDKDKVYDFLTEWSKDATGEDKDYIPKKLGFRRKLANAICDRFGTPVLEGLEQARQGKLVDADEDYSKHI